VGPSQDSAAEVAAAAAAAATAAAQPGPSSAPPQMPVAPGNFSAALQVCMGLGEWAGRRMSCVHVNITKHITYGCGWVGW
jgi:uncharacterized protein YraI